MLKKLLFILFFSLSFLQASFAQTTPTRSPLSPENFKWMVHWTIATEQGGTSCTGSIIEHGLVLTSKHCFGASANTHEGGYLDNSTTFFFYLEISNGDLIGNQFQSTQSPLRAWIDSGENDIAYILYDKTLTQDLFEPANYTTVEPQVSMELALLGVPGPLKIRSISSLCSFDGLVQPYQNPLEYEGLLWNTNCQGWWGGSGGAYIVTNGTPTSEDPILGVLTHTFDVDRLGRPLPEVIGSDSLGEHSKTTNFSPLFLAQDLNELVQTILNN